MQEEWKDIVGYEDSYQVSNFGRIRSKNRISPSGHNLKGVMRKPHSTKYGYQLVNLCKKGIVKHISVHRLVAETFMLNPESKEEVNHIDGNKSNNHLSNLEWVTRSENFIHAKNTGLWKMQGTDNHKSKLTEEQVREIRTLKKKDPKRYSNNKLANKYGLSTPSVWAIVTNKTWKHII